MRNCANWVPSGGNVTIDKEQAAQIVELARTHICFVLKVAD